MEKEINVNEDFKIRIEKDNYCIVKRFISNTTGKERWEYEGFYHSMEDLAEDLLDIMVLVSNEINGDLQSIITAVSRAKKEILKALK